MFLSQINLLKRNHGQTIIEAAVALAAILITLSSIAVVMITSLNNSQFIKDQTVASRYAQQGMEYIKSIRNNDPVTFFAYSGVKCFNQNNSISATSCATVNIANIYKREVEFDQNDSQCGADSSGLYGTKVTVNVYWSSSKCQASNTFCHSSSLVSCFTTIPDSLKSL